MCDILLFLSIKTTRWVICSVVHVVGYVVFLCKDCYYGTMITLSVPLFRSPCFISLLLFQIVHAIASPVVGYVSPAPVSLSIFFFSLYPFVLLPIAGVLRSSPSGVPVTIVHLRQANISTFSPH